MINMDYIRYNNCSYNGIENIKKFDKYLDDLIKEYGFNQIDNNYEDIKIEYILTYQKDKRYIEVEYPELL